MRDVNERHRGLDVVLSQYTKFVKPSFDEFCIPTKKYADIIVPRGPDNEGIFLCTRFYYNIARSICAHSLSMHFTN